MVDDMIDHLATVTLRPVWQEIPAEVRRRFQNNPPLDGEGAEKAYRDFQQYVLPYAEGNLHPRFWARGIGAGPGLGIQSSGHGVRCGPRGVLAARLWPGKP